MRISPRNKVISFDKVFDYRLVPDHFQSPYDQKPHILAKMAADQLLNFIENSSYWNNIPLYNDLKSHNRIGKMFGVLVVRDLNNGTIGFVAGFSGKLLGENTYTHFVPPVFDMLEKSGFYVESESQLINMSKSIKELENSDLLIQLEKQYKESILEIEMELQHEKRVFTENKKAILIEFNKDEWSLDERKEQEKKLQHKIIQLKIAFKAYKAQLNNRRLEEGKQLEAYKQQIIELKAERKLKSQYLQQWLYTQYTFLNIRKEVKNLKDIFENRDIPPSGSGECAAPKLLQHAFKFNLEPLCMAEFWWGRSPSSKQKIEGEYYPPCEEKCRPILKHMLKDL